MINNLHSVGSAHAAAVPQTTTSTLDKAYTILIAEDNPVNQMLAKTILTKAMPNADILVAEDGEQAVEAFLSNKLDLIFMDIQMPRMSGFEASKKIRSLEKKGEHIPIIALTARALKGEEEECLKHGMDKYITKPIVFEVVIAALQENLAPAIK